MPTLTIAGVVGTKIVVVQSKYKMAHLEMQQKQNEHSLVDNFMQIWK